VKKSETRGATVVTLTELITAAIVTVVLISSCSQSRAGMRSTETTCHGGRCTSTTSYLPSRPYFGGSMSGATVYDLPSNAETVEEAAAREERFQRWEAFCRPVGRLDQYGVTRMAYAHAGCEFGRSE
jgi:hypothetical protein